MSPSSKSTLLTVAAIRRPKGERAGVEVLFNERQQIFTLPSGAAARAGMLDRLGDALEKRLPVKADIDSRGGLVRGLAVASERQLAEFDRSRTLLEKPDRIVRLDVASIDPTRFNLVGIYLKWRTFGLCSRVIPNYRKAKEIFDFCAQQSCHLPGPTTVTPCIPFQYVRDGCYARAHKMRKIIEDDYGYCCEKVFSFANQNNDQLAVRANKWGGCCVTWWYHVAPLVRVRVRILGVEAILAMVIDPGMFDKPVLLSSWLMAQQDSGCSPRAHVSMYSVQPGSAYAPAGYAGTSFSTDDAYTATDATLIAYKNRTTCP